MKLGFLAPSPGPVPNDGGLPNPPDPPVAAPKPPVPEDDPTAAPKPPVL